MRSQDLLLAVAAAALLSACAPKEVTVGGAGGQGGSSTPGLQFDVKLKAGQGETVADVGDSKLTLGDLQGRLDRQSPFVRARYQSQDKREEFLDNQVRFEVLALEAMDRGLHQDPEVAEAVKKIIVQKLTRDEFDGKVKLSDVTEAEMEAYFNQHTDEYNKPEMLRSSIIKVNFGDDKAAAKKKAEEAQKFASNPKNLEDRAHFKNLVTRYSDDMESKRMGGDIRYLSADEVATAYGPAVRDALWALAKINDVSGVVEGQDGFYVVKKTGRRKPITRTFDQVKNQIRNLLYREKRTAAFDDFIGNLRKKFKVTTYPDKLKQLVVNTDAMPAGMEGGDPHDGAFGHPPPPAP